MATRNAATFPSRKLSFIEYGHALVGTHRCGHPNPRQNTLVIEGVGELDVQQLQRAVNQAADANPAIKVKLVGTRQHARWVDSGVAPRARAIAQCQWDGQSDSDADFIHRQRLSIRNGAIAEFIVANTPGPHNFLIFRSLHAAMDGMGCIHFVQEVFRALNREQLSGSDVFLSDTALMRQTGASACRVKSTGPCARLTGAPIGHSLKSHWRRLTFDGPPPWLLAKVATAISRYCNQHSDDTVRIVIPTNLRRHLSGRHSTMNYATRAYIDMHPGDSLATFNKQLHAVVKSNSEAVLGNSSDALRYLPMSWLDIFQAASGRVRSPQETITISDLGNLPARRFSTDTFKAKQLFALPLEGTISCIIAALESSVNITIGMPEANGNNGRLEDFVQYMGRAAASGFE